MSDKAVFAAIRTAAATHQTTISQYDGWAHRWTCTCGERSTEVDFGTVSYEARQHEDRARAAAAIEAMKPSIAAARREGWAEAVEALRSADVVCILIAHSRNSIERCACGWADLGKSHARHVVSEVTDYLSSIMGGTPEATE